MRRILKKTGKVAWRMFVLVAGLFLLIIGIIMIVTPGPAIVFIPAGLALLATEFQWARHILHRVRPMIDAAVEKAKKAKEAAVAKRNQKRSTATSTQRVTPPHLAAANPARKPSGAPSHAG